MAESCELVVRDRALPSVVPSAHVGARGRREAKWRMHRLSGWAWEMHRDVLGTARRAYMTLGAAAAASRYRYERQVTEVSMTLGTGAAAATAATTAAAAAAAAAPAGRPKGRDRALQSSLQVAAAAASFQPSSIQRIAKSSMAAHMHRTATLQASSTIGPRRTASTCLPAARSASSSSFLEPACPDPKFLSGKSSFIMNSHHT